MVTPAHARVFDVQRFSVHDGPGIRTTVFLKGCPLRCAWCQNPESIHPAPQLLLYPDLCAACGACREVCPEAGAGTGFLARPDACRVCGACAEVCPTEARRLVGRTMALEEVVAAGLRDRAFYGPDGGVTFGGGEPLAQWDAVRVMAQQLRAAGVHVAVDTSGYVGARVAGEVPDAVDLLLVDLKLRTPALHHRWTGVDNRPILDAIRGWSETMVGRLWVTTPVIPGVQDAAELEAMAAFLAGLAPPPPVRLIPYHRLGASKYAALGREAPDFPGDGAALLVEARAIYARHGLEIIDV
jgi:pyruvate formate lyase activating enzyme